MSFGSMLYIGKSTDYVVGTSATIQYRMGDKVALGTGIGGDFMVLSLYTVTGFSGLKNHQVGSSYYKFFTPVVPVELSFYFNKVLLNIRYEQGLVNRYRKPLADAAKDHYGLLVFELGYRIH